MAYLANSCWRNFVGISWHWDGFRLELSDDTAPRSLIQEGVASAEEGMRIHITKNYFQPEDIFGSSMLAQTHSMVDVLMFGMSSPACGEKGGLMAHWWGVRNMITISQGLSF